MTRSGRGFGGGMSFDQLEAAFAQVAGEIDVALLHVYNDIGAEVRDEWRDSAESMAPHAKNYARDITSEAKVTAGSIGVEIGPENRANRSHQGFLGRVLELGGSHSPAYLHGLHAMEANEPKLLARADSTIGFLLP